MGIYLWHGPGFGKIKVSEDRILPVAPGIEHVFYKQKTQKGTPSEEKEKCL